MITRKETIKTSYVDIYLKKQLSGKRIEVYKITTYYFLFIPFYKHYKVI